MKQTPIKSQQTQESSLNGMNSGNKTNSKNRLKEGQNNIQTFQLFENHKITKPIGLYDFNNNKFNASSLQESVEEVVLPFVEQNEETIIKYVVDEVKIKLNEKIEPLISEINNIKNNFNLLYNQGITNFKDLDVLNACHNNISNINNKVSLINENINKYIDGIKGFNITDNKLQFLNKLNKNLEDFINGVNYENYKISDMDIEEENLKIDIERKKYDNINQELDNIFKETISLLNNINKEEKYNLNNAQFQSNISDINNNLKYTINNFGNKYNYEKHYFDEQNINGNFCKKKIIENNNNLLENIPDFFDLNL